MLKEHHDAPRIKIENLVREIDDAVAEYRTKHASEPEVIVLGMEHRQAIKLMYPDSYGGGIDPRAWLGIDIVKKEEIIIL